MTVSKKEIDQDPIMTSIGKNLQKVVDQSVMDNASEYSISNASNISSISNVSAISNSSLYSIRQNQRIELFDYFKNAFSVYLSEITYHIGITLIFTILACVVNYWIIYGMIVFASLLLSILYVALIFSNIFTTLITALKGSKFRL